MPCNDTFYTELSWAHVFANIVCCLASILPGVSFAYFKNSQMWSVSHTCNCVVSSRTDFLIIFRPSDSHWLSTSNMTLKVSTFPSNNIYRYRLDVKEGRFLRFWKMRRKGSVFFFFFFSYWPFPLWQWIRSHGLQRQRLTWEQTSCCQSSTRRCGSKWIRSWARVLARVTQVCLQNF